MAIDRGKKYPLRTEVSSDYPGGKAKNRSTETADDGFPFDADIINDRFGFYDALIQGAGIQRSGVPDTAFESDHFDAMIKLCSAKNVQWLATKTYIHPTMIFANDGKLYLSLRDSTSKPPETSTLDWSLLDQQPGTNKSIFVANDSVWNSQKQYFHPVLVFGSDGKLYISKGDSLDSDPVRLTNDWMLFSSFLGTQSLPWARTKQYTHPSIALTEDGELYITRRDSVGQIPESTSIYWRRIGHYNNIPFWEPGKTYPEESLAIFNENIIYTSRVTNLSPENAASSWTSLNRIVEESVVPTWQRGGDYNAGDVVFNDEAKLFSCDANVNFSMVSPRDGAAGWAPVGIAPLETHECLLVSQEGLTGTYTCYDDWPEAPDGVGYAHTFYQNLSSEINAIEGAIPNPSYISLPNGSYIINGYAPRFLCYNKDIPISGAALFVAKGSERSNPNVMIKGTSALLGNIKYSKQGVMQYPQMTELCMSINGVITLEKRSDIQIGLVYTSFQRPDDEKFPLKYNFPTTSMPTYLHFTIPVIKLLFLKIG